MKKRFGVVGVFVLLAVLAVACGKAAAPAVSADSAASKTPEERSVSVPVPSGDAVAALSAVSTPPVAPAAPAAPEPAKPEPAKEGGTEKDAVPPPSPQMPVPPTAEPSGGATAQPAASAARPEPPTQTPPVPVKIARVGDMVITAQEFTRDLAQRAMQISQEQGQQVNPDDPDFRAATLAQMIDARVLRWVASRAVTVTDEELNREYERGRRIVGSEEKFQDYLKREGLDEVGLKALLRDRLAIEAYKKKKLDEAAVTEDEIKKLYDEWSGAGRFERKERTADILHLGVHPEGDQPADMEKAKKTVEDARARIAAGEPFSQVAIEVSDDKNVAQTGGFYPEASAARLPAYIADRMFQQNVGDVSEPFEGGNAWHLLKVLSVNEPGKVTLEKAHDQIRNYLLDSKRQEEVAKAVDQAKYLMDIEIYKAELRPKEGPGSGLKPAEQPLAPPETRDNTAQ